MGECGRVNRHVVGVNAIDILKENNVERGMNRMGKRCYDCRNKDYDENCLARSSVVGECCVKLAGIWWVCIRQTP